MRVYGRDGQLALLVNLVDAQWTSPFRVLRAVVSRDRPGLAWTTASASAGCHHGCKHPAGARVRRNSGWPQNRTQTRIRNMRVSTPGAPLSRKRGSSPGRRGRPAIGGHAGSRWWRVAKRASRSWMTPPLVSARACWDRVAAVRMPLRSRDGRRAGTVWSLADLLDERFGGRLHRRPRGRVRVGCP